MRISSSAETNGMPKEAFYWLCTLLCNYMPHLKLEGRLIHSEQTVQNKSSQDHVQSFSTHWVVIQTKQQKNIFL